MRYRYFSVIVISETICISFHRFFPCVLYYIKLHCITLSYYLVYASLLSLLQLFFCLHVRLLYYLLTYSERTTRKSYKKYERAAKKRLMWPAQVQYNGNIIQVFTTEPINFLQVRKLYCTIVSTCCILACREIFLL